MGVEQNNLIEMAMLNKPLTIKEAIRKIIELKESNEILMKNTGIGEYKGLFWVEELVLIDNVLYGKKEYDKSFIKILIDDKQNKYDYNVMYEYEYHLPFEYCFDKKNYKGSTFRPNWYNKVRTKELTDEVLEIEKYLNSLDYTGTSNEGEYYADIDYRRIHKYVNSDCIYYTESIRNPYRNYGI